MEMTVSNGRGYVDSKTNQKLLEELNSTKEQILLSSRNLSVAKSKFDFVEQNN